MAENECFELSTDQEGLMISGQWNEAQQAAYDASLQTEVGLPMLQSCMEDIPRDWQPAQHFYQQSSVAHGPFDIHQTIVTTCDRQQQFAQQHYPRQELYLTGSADVDVCNEQIYSFAASPVINGSLTLHSSPMMQLQASPGSITSTPITTYSQLPALQLQSTTRFREDDFRLGRPNYDGTWSCTFPTCTSEMRFTRGCDLRKHHKRHFKIERCRYPECQFSQNACFSSKKDRNRHEAGHRPGIPCAQGCGRLFSREDNMRDHMRRVHHRHTNT